jgi:hypothetical protein
MGQASSYTYSVSSNGAAADWYWQVTRNQEVIARGLATTEILARANAMKAALSHADPGQQNPPPYLEDSSPPSLGPV